MRRSALFSWRFAPPTPQPPADYAGLVKIDRSGGGQLLNSSVDFFGVVD